MAAAADHAEALGYYRSMFELAAEGILVVDGRTGVIVDANPRAAEVTGRSVAEMVGNTALLISPPVQPNGWTTERFAEHVMLRAAAGEKPAFEWMLFHHPDGAPILVEATLIMLPHPIAGKRVMRASMTDITERRRAEIALRTSEARYRRLFENAPDAIVILDIERMVFIDANPRAGELYGRPVAKVLGLSPWQVSPPRQPDGRDSALAARELIERTMHGERPRFEWMHQRADGTQVLCEIHLVAMPSDSGMLLRASMFDITQRRRDEARLEAGRRKELMLTEIYHRVKNNLQVVSSLLSMQLRSVADERMRTLLADSIGRVKSMALVHEQLYVSQDLAHIDFGAYLKSLVDQLDSSSRHAGDAPVEVRVEEVAMGVEMAVTCGLVAHELISNALKHGYPRRSRGRVQVGFGRAPGGSLRLVVEDDGVGLPPQASIESCGTLGLKLVASLVRQLDGRLQVVGGAGTRFEVTWPG